MDAEHPSDSAGEQVTVDMYPELLGSYLKKVSDPQGDLLFDAHGNLKVPVRLKQVAA